jgi:hypothetical protein
VLVLDLYEFSRIKDTGEQTAEPAHAHRIQAACRGGHHRQQPYDHPFG